MTPWIALLSGMFLFNAIPHLVQGICGKRHMTPFSRNSSPVTNVLWGWANVGAGIWLLYAAPPAWSARDCGAFAAGGLLVSVFLALFWANPDARLPWHRKEPGT